jgi:hypothetical protein
VRRHSLLVGVVVLMMSVNVAWGSPSLLGPTGLLRVPTADTLGALQWNVGASNIWAAGGPDESSIYANVGLLPRLEVGASRNEFEDLESETLLNAKYAFLKLPGEVSLAGGVIDLTDQIDQSAYVVVTHTLGAGVISPHGQFTMPQLHVGAGGGRFDGLFGGVSVLVGTKADVMAEYDGENFNLGVSLPLMPKVELTAATIDTFDDFGLGVSASSPW